MKYVKTANLDIYYTPGQNENPKDDNPGQEDYWLEGE